MVAAAAGSALVWFLGLLTASVSLLVGNKFVAQSYSANNLTILFQNGVAALILYAGARAGRFDMKPLKEGQFRAMAVPALLNSLQLLTHSNYNDNYPNDYDSDHHHDYPHDWP